MDVYLQGFLMGLAYVAPIGVQNLFVINSAISQKRGRALLIALIVIFFDITLAFACFFGIGLLIDKLEWLKINNSVDRKPYCYLYWSRTY